MAELCDQLRTLLALPAALPPVAARTFLLPEGQGPFPAVLYCHAHGGEYELGRRELTQGARWLSSPYAPDLLAAGFAILCVDMAGFGDRKSEGSESALAKAGLWRGEPLFGQMVADQLAAIEWLAARPEVDETRIAALGMSMGAALAIWTAALEPRISAVAHLCMLADIEPLIKAGAHDRHGLFLMVPGLLQHCEFGDVAATIAPRPQFVAHGGQDAITPPAARDAALDRLLAAYGTSQALKTHLDGKTGHCETPDMRAAVLEFLGHVCGEPQIKMREIC